MAEDTKASSKKHIPMLLLWTASTKHVKESLTVVLKYPVNHVVNKCGLLFHLYSIDGVVVA